MKEPSAGLHLGQRAGGVTFNPAQNSRSNDLSLFCFELKKRGEEGNKDKIGFLVCEALQHCRIALVTYQPFQAVADSVNGGLTCRDQAKRPWNSSQPGSTADVECGRYMQGCAKHCSIVALHWSHINVSKLLRIA